MNDKKRVARNSALGRRCGLECKAMVTGARQGSRKAKHEHVGKKDTEMVPPPEQTDDTSQKQHCADLRGE